MVRWAYVNGRFVSPEQALIRADTSAVYGRGLVETMRSYGGRLFRYGAHHERLLAGAVVLGIDVCATSDGLEAALVELLARNEIEEARVRLIVTDGGGAGANVIGLAGPLDGRTDEQRERGVSAVVSETRRNEVSPLSRLKSLQRVDDQLARERARELGADEAILLNTKGNVAEGSVSNVFVVSGGRLTTPSVESGALPGTARAVVLELARDAGIGFAELEIEPDALRGADEAFVTNSVIEVVSLTRLDGKAIGDGHAGPVTRRLSQMYSDLVGRETSTAVSWPRLGTTWGARG